MPTVEAARALYDDQERIVRAAVIAASRLYGGLDPTRLTASWVDERIGDQLFLTVARAQELAAIASSVYTDLILEAAGTPVVAEATLRPASLAGIASDGRPLDSLITQPLISTTAAQGAGMTGAQALQVGLNALTRIVATQVQDVGRAATGITVAARPRTGYVRLVNPGACARCTILAGRFYRWSDGFKRHPLCGCRNIPSVQDRADDVRTGDPRGLFYSLSEAEQNRQFTRAGAQAIRDGADPIQVVNARRGLGLTTAGGGQTLRTTTEGTTSRGTAGRALIEQRGSVTTRTGTATRISSSGPVRRDVNTTRAVAPRLMPESIYEIADDRADALRLLRLNGYVT